MTSQQKLIHILSTSVFGAETNPKKLISDANMRRRMSRLVKMGTCVGLECLSKAGVETPDAIITATGYGFLADSEKFLSGTLDNAPQPTPFIQSTFNTIGSTLSILTHQTGYNMTFAHMQNSFASALTDALLLLNNNEAQTVLIVAADELTATLAKILRRMGAGRGDRPEPSEGAIAFLLSTTGESKKSISNWFTTDYEYASPTDFRYPTASAERLYELIDKGEAATFKTGRIAIEIR